MIFLSYASEDATLAQQIQTELETRLPRPARDTAPIVVWCDRSRTGLRPGDDWRRVLDDVIRESAIVLVLVTKNARQSEYVTYEWAFALGACTKVVPIVADKQALHPRLAVLQYFDFSAAPAWDDLAKNLRDFIEEKGLNEDLWMKKTTEEGNPWENCS